MNNKIPPPIITLICGLGIYFSRPLFPKYNYISIDIIAASFLLLGIIILITAVLSFKRQSTTISPLQPEKASYLVVSGIFKYSRNPMYLGMVFILLGLTLIFNLIGGILCTILFMLYISVFQIKPEEIVMDKLFGEEFANYKKSVRKWL